jgi:UDP-N-acetylglucosamine--N-acetylmuramyl-(pentapeptide) pyrophosphoryl-undecaprenol N-acetylglucosamine transferase
MGAMYRAHRDLCEVFQRFHQYLRMLEFLPDLYARLPAFDLAICRAGHSTLWELALSGVPAVCIPHSRVEDRLQARYARAMERRGTALVMPPSVDAGTLGAELAALWEDAARRQKMSAAGLALREKADGAEKVAEAIAARLEA